MGFTLNEIKTEFLKNQGWKVTKETKNELRLEYKEYNNPKYDNEFKFWFENGILTDLDVNPGIAFENYADEYDTVQDIIKDAYSNMRIYKR